jgi:hypothetical protein
MYKYLLGTALCSLLLLGLTGTPAQASDNCDAKIAAILQIISVDTGVNLDISDSCYSTLGKVEETQNLVDNGLGSESLVTNYQRAALQTCGVAD